MIALRDTGKFLVYDPRSGYFEVVERTYFAYAMRKKPETPFAYAFESLPIERTPVKSMQNVHRIYKKNRKKVL